MTIDLYLECAHNTTAMPIRLKTIFVTLSAFFLTILLSPVLKAASTATVTATVTVQNISVSVSDGTVSYGTLATSGTKDTTSTGTDDSQTATNNGNVTEDFNIKGQNTASWTLAATQSTDQYFHKFCVTNCDASPTWTALTTSYQTLGTAIATSGTKVFDLQIGVPSSSSSYTQQSVDVTVQAAAN